MGGVSFALWRFGTATHAKDAKGLFGEPTTATGVNSEGAKAWRGKAATKLSEMGFCLRTRNFAEIAQI
jgi:hypothetical protein